MITNPLHFFYPENEKDIQAIVAEAESQGLRVRAVGSGHSFSEAAKGKDFLLDMKSMRNAFRYEASLIKASFQTQNYVVADAGITIRRLNRILDKMKLALQNMGAVDFQTVSGALMTGTHGTGIKQPAFPDMVRAIRIVATGGELIQIEPTEGITDPIAHAQNADIKLIQDDDIFYSNVLSFGGMGIVYQLILEVAPWFWIQEKRYLQNWTALKQELKDGRFMQKVEENDFVAFRVNPHKIDGDHLCSIVVQNILQPTPALGFWAEGKRNVIAGIVSNMEFLIEGLIRTINRNPRKIKKRIQLSLKYSRVKNYMDKSFKVLYQHGAAVLRYGISSEFAFDAKAGKVIDVLETIFEQTKYLSEYADLYHSAHIPVRFVMPSKAYLSSAYQRPTVYIDVPTLFTSIGDYEILERYQTMLMKLDGIPHWGKMNQMMYLDHPFIQSHFPKVQSWIKVRNQMDPKGTFLNDFIVKMGLNE
jgi:FAD/FMN-containing dehydrogenase